MPLEDQARPRATQGYNRYVRLANMVTDLFGAVSIHRYADRYHHLYDESGNLEDLLFSVVAVARQGKGKARLVRSRSGNLAIAHHELVRSFHEDGAYIVLTEEDQGLNDAIGQCLCNQTAASLRQANLYDDMNGLRDEKEPGLFEGMHSYLASHVPEGQDPERWPVVTLATLAKMARRTLSVEALLGALAARGVTPSAEEAPVLEGLLVDLLHDLPHWGCELPLDENELHEKLQPVAGDSQSEPDRGRFLDMLWGDNQERRYCETAWE